MSVSRHEVWILGPISVFLAWRGDAEEASSKVRIKVVCLVPSPLLSLPGFRLRCTSSSPSFPVQSYHMDSWVGVCTFVHACVRVWASMYAMAILWILFLPSAFTWVLGRLDLHDKCFYPLSHRAILRFIEFLPLFLQLGFLSYF